MAVFPIIVGCGRSGTTLLRRILTSHSMLAIPYESHFIVAMGDDAVRPRYETRYGFDSERFFADLLAQPAVRRWSLPEEELRAMLIESPPPNFAEAVRNVFGLYARLKGKLRYGDKTAVYVLSIPMLSTLFPEARFIHVIRDGRDVALSWMVTGWDFGPETVEEAALYWRYHVQRGRRTGSYLGPERYLEVHYEQLVTHPRSVVERLCEFIDLEFDPAMLTRTDTASEMLAEMPRPGHHQNLLISIPAQLRDWRQDMCRNDIQIFEALAGELLSDLGYELAGGVTGPR